MLYTAAALAVIFKAWLKVLFPVISVDLAMISPGARSRR